MKKCDIINDIFWEFCSINVEINNGNKYDEIFLCECLERIIL